MTRKYTILFLTVVILSLLFITAKADIPPEASEHGFCTMFRAIDPANSDAFRKLLDTFGFGSAGVGKNSWAAWWQSTIGNVEKGSLLAKLQSLGATCAFDHVTTASHAYGAVKRFCDAQDTIGAAANLAKMAAGIGAGAAVNMASVAVMGPFGPV
eukprot:UN07284